EVGREGGSDVADLDCPAAGRQRGHHTGGAGEDLKRADSAAGGWSGEASLIGREETSQGVAAPTRIATPDGRAAGQQGVGLGRPTIVLQRTQDRNGDSRGIAIDGAVAGTAYQIIASEGEGTRTIPEHTHPCPQDHIEAGSLVVGDDCVLNVGDPPVVEHATPDAASVEVSVGPIIGNRGIEQIHCRGGAIPDAPAILAAAVATHCAVDKGQDVEIVDASSHCDSAAVAVAAHRTVDESQRSVVENAASSRSELYALYWREGARGTVPAHRAVDQCH